MAAATPDSTLHSFVAQQSVVRIVLFSTSLYDYYYDIGACACMCTVMPYIVMRVCKTFVISSDRVFVCSFYCQ